MDEKVESGKNDPDLLKPGIYVAYKGMPWWKALTGDMPYEKRDGAYKPEVDESNSDSEDGGIEVEERKDRVRTRSQSVNGKRSEPSKPGSKTLEKFGRKQVKKQQQNLAQIASKL